MADRFLLRWNDTFRDVAVLGKFLLTSFSILLMFQPGHTSFISCFGYVPPTSSIPPMGQQQVQKFCGPFADFKAVFGSYIVTFAINLVVFVFATIVRSRNLFHAHFRGVCLGLISIMTLTSLGNIFIIFSINFMDLQFDCAGSSIFSVSGCADKWLNNAHTYRMGHDWNYTQVYSMQCSNQCQFSQPTYFQPLAATLILSFLYFFSLILSYYAKNVAMERAEDRARHAQGSDAVEKVSAFYARHHNLIQDLAAFVKFTLTSVVIYLILSSNPIGCNATTIPGKAGLIPAMDLVQYCQPTIASGQVLPQIFLYTFCTNLTAFIIIVFIRHQNAMAYSYRSVSAMILVVSILMTAAKIYIVFRFVYSQVLFLCYPPETDLIQSGVISIGMCSELEVERNMTGSYGLLTTLQYVLSEPEDEGLEYLLPSWLRDLGHNTLQCSDVCTMQAPHELFSLTGALFFSLLYTLQVMGHYYASNSTHKAR